MAHTEFHNGLLFTHEKGMTNSCNRSKSPDVHLAQWSDQDAAQMFKAMSDERIYENIREIPPRTPSELAIRYESRPDAIGRTVLNYSVWVDDKVIGLAQAVIEPDSASASVGYKTSPKSWGAGIGTSLLGNLLTTVAREYGISIFRAEVDSKNIASIKILEKNGFIQIASKPGTLKFQSSTELIFERDLSPTGNLEEGINE